MNSALFRNDRGGLELRRYATPADARAASAASGRELAEPSITLAPHPRGGYTHARRTYGSARIYEGNWPTLRAARHALNGRIAGN